MNGFTVALLVLLGIAIAVGAFILAVWIFVWNINDMLANGVNFWNVFWPLLAATLLFGGSAKAAS